jgi:hypothetical protein
MKNLLFFLFIIVPLQAIGQTQVPDSLKNFKYGGFTSLSFSQVSLSNWAAGGENSVSGLGILNLFSNYKKDNLIWNNSLDLAYGMLRTGSQTRKNEDKIEMNSQLGYKAFGKFYYSALLNFRTQFADGYNYPNDSVIVSRFMAPGYISISLGLDYRPVDYFSIYLSPVAGRFTVVNDKALSDSGRYGVDRGKKVRHEFGASLSARFQKDVVKNVNLISNLILFNNYTDKVVDNRGNIAVNWEVMLNIKAGKYLTTSVRTNLIYDQNVIAKTQFKESIGIGLSYKL